MMHLSNHQWQSAERQSSVPAASLTGPGALEAEACVFSAERDKCKSGESNGWLIQGDC